MEKNMGSNFGEWKIYISATVKNISLSIATKLYFLYHRDPWGIAVETQWINSTFEAVRWRGTDAGARSPISKWDEQH